MKEKLEQRIVQYQQALEKSVANHNMLLGAKAEAEAMLKELYESELAESAEAKKELDDAAG